MAKGCKISCPGQFGPHPMVRVKERGGDKLDEGVGAQAGKALAALVPGFNFSSR